MLYIAAVSAVGIKKPSTILLIIAIAFAPLVVWLGNLSLVPAKRLGYIGRRAALAAAATAISDGHGSWSSGWQDVDAIASHPKIAAVAAAALGLVFGLIASIIVPEEE